MNKVSKQATGLYADKDLKVNLTDKGFDKVWSGKVIYFWDGNNGDKHLIVGHTVDSKGNVETVLAINLSQSYLSGSYDSFANANKLAENMIQPEDGSELVSLFNKVKVFNWNY